MSEQPEQVAPIINLNGTSAARLINDLSEVYNAATELLDKLKECGPNGRDYYLKPGLMDKALDQHRWRGGLIHHLRNSIEAEIAAIEEQRKGQR